VKHSIARTIALSAASIAVAQSAFSASPYFTPHPAVVRVVAPENDGVAYGSGTLVAVNESFGLVVTNWHVVRDATGQIGVIFPDGFRSAATVVRTDREWDLAALAIWRPKVQPVRVSSMAPQPGEVLTIAGYGSGNYRAISGRCTQYYSPGGNQPNELVELDAPARNGDSGGPILNSRGELAGVLFGSAFGKTTGSYCGRLSWFLNAADVDFRRISPQGPMVAEQQPTREAVPVAAISRTQPISDATTAEPIAEASHIPSQDTYRQAPASPSVAEMSPINGQKSVASEMSPYPCQSSSSAPTASISNRPVPPPSSSMPTTDGMKTILAAIGAVALLYHALRLLGAAVG